MTVNYEIKHIIDVCESSMGNTGSIHIIMNQIHYRL